MAANGRAVQTLDAEGCRRLADALGDQPDTIIAGHALRQGLCSAYTVGLPDHPRAALVQTWVQPDEPLGFGADPALVWELLQVAQGWTCVRVALDVAEPLGATIARARGVGVRYLDDVVHVLPGPPAAYHDARVRLLTPADVALLEAAPPELRLSGFPSVGALLAEGAVAGAIVGGLVVATASTAALNARYAEVGVYTTAAYRRQGLSTAAAGLVCQAVRATGRTPVWSAGDHNAASLRVAAKLGFVEVSRGRYAILERAASLQV
ncbi:MAG: GNAT family N-acetyltransferase [Chloroflexota bacterium]